MANEPRVHVGFADHFTRVVRRLKKKYPHILDDVQPLIDTLEQGETPGDQVQGVGYTAYKARMKNRDARRGKSGGYRAIYYIRTVDRIILLTVYTKSEQRDISSEELRRIIDEVEAEPPETE
jgi:mRNA-degrading endonuclease RelE of RelBE toxin-antitoxin system